MCSRNDGELETHELHMILQNYINTETTVTHMQPGYASQQEKTSGSPSFSISLCDDNSAFTKATNLALPDQKTTLYPPPSAQVIQKIVFSIRLNRLIVLLTNSTLCVYKMYKETALLEKIQESSEVYDSEGKRALGQAVTSMEIVNTRGRDIRAMDTDVLNHRLHVVTLFTAMADPRDNQEFLALGLNKGSVIMIHVR